MTDVERYKTLRLEEALHRSSDYASACKELSFLLRRCYPKLSKALQSLLFQHTLTAFRLIPLQPGLHVASTNLLMQASEAVLPKQRKVMAISEFKHAVVARKRGVKGLQDNEGLVRLLPNDVLCRVLSFLDLCSLVAASFVCREWRSASCDDVLWQRQYSLFFGNNEVEHPKIMENVESRVISNEDGTLAAQLCWRQAFRSKVTGKSWSFTSGRGYCGNCKDIIWLSGLTHASPHQCVNNGRIPIMIRPISFSKVAEYLSGEITLLAPYSDSSSDSDDSSLANGGRMKLWAYPRRISRRLHAA